MDRQKIEGINRTRAANFRKATELKKMGFASAAHALPEEAKSELDRLLLTGTSVRESLRIVSNQFPKIKFPSVNALNNYKNKYLVVEMTREIPRNVIALSHTETERIVRKLKKGIGEFYLHLAETVLPKLLEGLNEGLEKEKLIKMPMKINSDRALAISALVRELNNFVRGNGVNVLEFEQRVSMVADKSEEVPGVIKEDVYDKLARVLSRRGFMFTEQRKVTVSKTNAKSP